MLELVSLLLSTLARLFHGRHDLVVENLLLRHQLHVALRSRPRPDLKTRDRFFWLVVRSLYPDWKRHLSLVRPETVVRWHRRGWVGTVRSASATCGESWQSSSTTTTMTALIAASACRHRFRSLRPLAVGSLSDRS